MNAFSMTLNFSINVAALKKMGYEVTKKAVTGGFVHQVSKDNEVLFAVPFNSARTLKGNFSKQPSKIQSLLRQAGAVLSAE